MGLGHHFILFFFTFKGPTRPLTHAMGICDISMYKQQLKAVLEAENRKVRLVEVVEMENIEVGAS